VELQLPHFPLVVEVIESGFSQKYELFYAINPFADKFIILKEGEPFILLGILTLLVDVESN